MTPSVIEEVKAALAEARVACGQISGYDTAVDAIDRALAALSGAGVPEGWRTIESAPKDGTPILAIVHPNYYRHMCHQKGRMFCIRYETFGGKFGGWGVYPGYGGAPDGTFTHWQPLPEPPK